MRAPGLVGERRVELIDRVARQRRVVAPARQKRRQHQRQATRIESMERAHDSGLFSARNGSRGWQWHRRPRATTASPRASAPRSCRGRCIDSAPAPQNFSAVGVALIAVVGRHQQRRKVVGPFPDQAVQVVHAVGVRRLRPTAANACVRRPRIPGQDAFAPAGSAARIGAPLVGGGRVLPLRPLGSRAPCASQYALRREPADPRHGLLRQRRGRRAAPARPNATGSALRRTRRRTRSRRHCGCCARTRGTRALVTGRCIRANGAMRTRLPRVFVLQAAEMSSPAGTLHIPGVTSACAAGCRQREPRRASATKRRASRVLTSVTQLNAPAVRRPA